MKPVIIYPPTIDWDFLHQRPQQLLRALSCLGCICLFCNLNSYKQHSNGICRLNDNLALANGISFSAAVEWARAAYPQSPLVAYFTYPQHIEQVRAARTDLIVFDSVDEPAGEFTNWLADYAKAVQDSDIVTATSRSLVARALQYKFEVELIPNGCDYQHFQAAQTRQPIDCAPFNRGNQVIGYIGAIAPWLDWSLIHVMAHYLPDYEFVFIGPLLLKRGISLTSGNMHYLGHKNYVDLPRYMSNFNYCLIPFKLTEMTKGVNPIKFWEYLAGGQPILSTPLPEIPQKYVTLIAEDMFPGFTPGDMEAGREERIGLSRDNSWTARAVQLLSAIQRKLECG